MNYAYYQPEQKNETIELFRQTFSDSEGENEGNLIAKLVTDFLTLPAPEEDLHVFIAQDDNRRMVGGTFFSRLTFPNGENVFVMAPVAVATDCHGQGIGQALINFALKALKNKGVAVVVSYGDINYYSKTGFAPITEDLIQAPVTLSIPEGWIAQPLNSTTIQPIVGKPICLEAINSPDYW